MTVILTLYQQDDISRFPNLNALRYTFYFWSGPIDCFRRVLESYIVFETVTRFRTLDTAWRIGYLQGGADMARTQGGLTPTWPAEQKGHAVGAA